MTDLVSVGGKLAIICAIAAIALGLVNTVTAPAIARVKEEQLAAALAVVSGSYSPGEVVMVEGAGVIQGYYPLFDNNNDTVGYILRLLGMGYGGDMELLSSVSPDGAIAAVTLMDNAETPGLGQEAEKPEYMEKFVGKGHDVPIPTSKQQLTQDQADSISGASITFIGIGQALADGSEYIKTKFGD